MKLVPGMNGRNWQTFQFAERISELCGVNYYTVCVRKGVKSDKEVIGEVLERKYRILEVLPSDFPEL